MDAEVRVRIGEVIAEAYADWRHPGGREDPHLYGPWLGARYNGLLIAEAVIDALQIEQYGASGWQGVSESEFPTYRLKGI